MTFQELLDSETPITESFEESEETITEDPDLEDEIEDLSDEELSRLANDLSAEIEDDIEDESEEDEPEEEEIELNDDEDEEDEIEDAIDDIDDEPQPLTPSQDADADDMMAVAATSQLLQTELNDDERAAITESAEALQCLVDEGFILESDAFNILYGCDEDIITEKAWYSNKQRIQLGKEARMKQLWSVAVFAEARARNDADYRKLQKVYKMRNILRARLEKKYDAPAKKRVRTYIQRLRDSKSGVLNKIAKRFNK